MAIQNDPRLYTAFSERLDSRPHTALYANLMQRKAARDEAFDEYIRNMNMKINTAGMRNQDRPVFDKQLSDWQKYGMENRDAIRNRKNGADIEFANKYQQLMNLVGESKSAEEGKKPIVEKMIDPNFRDRLNNDNFLEMMNAQDQPLYTQGEDGTIARNPNFKPIDYSKIEFDAKPFDQTNYLKSFSDIKRTDLAPKIVTDPKSLTQTTTTTSVFDEPAKDVIASRAVTSYANDKSFRELIKKLNPEDYNDFYKQNYGHDIQNEGDLAAAFTLKNMQEKVSTSKVEPDWLGRDKLNQEQAKELEGIRQKNRVAIEGMRQRNREAFYNFKKSSTINEQQGVLNKYIDGLYSEGGKSKSSLWNPINGKWETVRTFPVPREIEDKYRIVSKDEKGNPVWDVPKFYITEDKKYLVPVYKDNSQPQTKPVPIETFKGDLGKLWLTKKDIGNEITGDFDDEGGNEEIEISSGYNSTPTQPQAPLD